MAVLGEKDALGILQELEPIAHQIIITTNSSPRAMSVADLEKIAVEVFGADRVFTEATLTSAIDRAVKDSVRPLSDDTLGILITGSVVTVGEARSIIRRKFSKEVKESE